MVILAVDPGQSGAAALLGNPQVQPDGSLHAHLDVRRDFKTLQDIARGIRGLTDTLPGYITHAVIERVSAMAGQGVCSMFSFGRSTGVAFGALESCLPDLRVKEVSPIKWQYFFRDRLEIQKSEEFNSRMVAAKVIPASIPFLKRKLDHNTADAILMACWRFLDPSADTYECGTK